MMTSLTTSGRRMQAGLAGFEIDLLAGAGDHADLQVDHAVLAEGSEMTWPFWAFSSTRR